MTKWDARSWAPAELIARTAREISKSEEEVVLILSWASFQAHETLTRTPEDWDRELYYECISVALGGVPEETALDTVRAAYEHARSAP